MQGLTRRCVPSPHFCEPAVNPNFLTIILPLFFLHLSVDIPSAQRQSRPVTSAKDDKLFVPRSVEFNLPPVEGSVLSPAPKRLAARP